MFNPNWIPIQNPLFRWATSVERIICAHDLPRCLGPVIYIVSDYSGNHESSKYQVISVLYVDIEASRDWEWQRRVIRREYLSDGRRLSFKALNDKQRQKALVPFLQTADFVRGLSLTLAISKSVRSLCIYENEVRIAHESFGLKCKWTFRALERALRTAHVISLLTAGLSHPKQDVYWISDEDDLFANSQRSEDLQRILGKFSGHYVKHELGNLGMGTTTVDEGDRFEEDLTAIPDLIAGAVSEVATSLAKSAGGKLPTSLALQFDKRFSPKTEVISSWLWAENSRLARIVIAVEPYGKRGYSVFRLTME